LRTSGIRGIFMKTTCFTLVQPSLISATELPARAAISTARSTVGDWIFLFIFLTESCLLVPNIFDTSE